MRIYNQPAYLLHSRPYRDTSLLLDFLTRDHGRLSLIGKGIRQAKSKTKGLLQLFTPLQISYSGKSELKTLTQVELVGSISILKSERLFSAMYMNELVVKLIQGHEIEGSFFDHYAEILHGIHEGGSLEPLLRMFELYLLEDAGYGLVFEADADSGEEVTQECFYRLHLDMGFTAVDSIEAGEVNVFSGAVLLAIARHDFSDMSLLSPMKSLMRQLLAHRLGGSPLKSRLLFTPSRKL